MEFCEAEDGSEREEQQHGIQKNEPGYAQPRNICGMHASVPGAVANAYMWESQVRSKGLRLKGELTAEYHQSNQVACHPGHPKLHCRVPPKWHERNTERREDDAHSDVRHILRVHGAALEAERAIVPS